MKDKKRYLTLNDLSAYKISLGLSNYVWNIVEKWDFFKKKTVGGQFVRSVDSISANIAEGFGRSSSPDKANRYTIARGECTEVQALLIISLELKRITHEQSVRAIALTDDTGKLLSGLIRTYTSSKP